MGAEDGTTAVAPEGEHLVEVGAAIVVHVTVRDQSGMPLRDASVTLQAGGSVAAGPTRTDATGLATMNTTNRANLTARATRDGFDPTSERLVVGESATVFVTVRMPRPFDLQHPYLWMNGTLRRRLYAEHPGDREDPGAVRPVSADDRKSREERLLEIANFLREALDAPALPEATAAAEAAERERLTDVDRRLAALDEDNTAGGLEDDADADLWRVEDDMNLARTGDERHRPARSAARRDIGAARELVAGRLGRLSDIARTHRQLLEYLVRVIFPADTHGGLAPWLRYMIVHFTGLRYVNSNSSYYEPGWVLADARRRDLANHEIGSDSARLAIYLGELRRELARHTSGHRPVRDALEYLERMDPASTGRHRGRESLQDAVVVALTALADAWCEGLEDRESLGLLKMRHDSDLVPTAGRITTEWPWIEVLTSLRNDMTEWAVPSGHRPDGEGTLLHRSAMGAWKTRQNRDLLPAPWGAECNQIAEMAAQARGMEIDSGISRGSASDEFAPRGYVLPDPAGPTFGHWSVRATEPARPDPEPATPTYDTHKLFRPTSAAELQQGDMFFKMKWVQIHETRDRGSNWVLWNLDMRYAVGRTYNPGDPTPTVNATRTDVPHWEGGDHRGRVPPTRTTSNFTSSLSFSEPTGPEEVIDPATLEEIGEDELTNLEVEASEFQEAPPAEGEEPRNVNTTAPTYAPLVRPVPRTPPSTRGLYARCGTKIVRRHPSSSTFHDVLIWYHEGTIVATHGSTVYTYETAAPTGMRDWPFATLCGSWTPPPRTDPSYTVYGRAPGHPERPELARHLDPAVLLGPHLED